MNKKYGKRTLALLMTLMLLMATFLSTAVAVENTDDMDARDLGDEVILEDPDLIGDLEEDVYDEQEPIPDETDDPSDNASDEETPEPSDDPESPPTDAPSPAYDIQMEPPSGWYANRAVMEVTIHDVGGTGWGSVSVTMDRSSGSITLIDGALPSGHIWIELLENCTVETVVTDPNGEKHSKKVTVNCFDKDNPSLSASVKGEYLYIEASDRHSGVAAVQVNGTLYTELNDGKLEIWLKQYADAYEQLLVQAVDRVGNVSKAIAVANPFYQRPSTNTQAPVATATPKPTKKPSDGNGNSNGNGGSGNGNSATATTAPTITPTLAPTITPLPDFGILSPTAVEAGFPFNYPGNSFTRDLLYDKYTNKQFIAIETRSGDVFYIVIDYDKPLDEKGERYETYFLNLVDSRDLMDIVGEKETPEPQIIYVTPEPTIQPTPAPIPVEPEKKDNGSGGMIGLIVILIAAGGGAYWYFKIRKPSGSGKAQMPFDDYDLDDDDEDEELENEDE